MRVRDSLTCSGVILAAGLNAANGQAVAHWTRAVSGLYSDAENWSGHLTPINDDVLTWDVRVPGDGGGASPVHCDVSGEITHFELAPDYKMTVSGSLSVLEVASIGGILDVAGGAFTASGSASLSGTRAQIWTYGAGYASVHAADYSATGLWFDRTGPQTNEFYLLSADGVGSELDLPALVSIDSGFDSGGDDSDIHYVRATNGGVIRLPSVEVITGPADGTDSLSLGAGGAASSIELDSLRTLTTVPGPGRVELWAWDDASLGMPSIESMQDTTLGASAGGRIAATSGSATYSATGLWFNRTGAQTNEFDLLSADGVGSELDLPALVSIDSGFDSGGDDSDIHHVRATNGGVIRLPSVEVITGPVDGTDSLSLGVGGATSSIELDSLRTLTTVPGPGRVELWAWDDASLGMPSIESMQDTTLGASAGGRIAATSGSATYSATGLWFNRTGAQTNEFDLLSADGVGSELDLPALVSIDSGFDSGGDDSDIHHVRATNGGVIRLPNVEVITLPDDVQDSVRITASDDASIDLGAARTLGGAGGGGIRVQLAGGDLLFGSLDGTDVSIGCSLDRAASLTLGGELALNDSDWVWFADASSSLSIGGSLVVSAPAYFGAPEGGDVVLEGACLSYTNTDEGNVELDRARVGFSGAGTLSVPQTLEVASFDIGPSVHPNSTNFALGQLSIGTVDQSTVVQLADANDNGNRDGVREREALYLYAIDDQTPGLRIGPGSTLVLNDLTVYAWERPGESVQDLRQLLIDSGLNELPFDQGSIRLIGESCIADFNGDGLVDTRDVLSFLNAWSRGESSADVNCDGVVNTQDLIAFLNLWTVGC